MAKNLTLKQEKFCLEYIETGNASEAYRRAFNTERMKPETVNRNAKAMIDDSKIATRLQALKKPVIEKMELNLEKVLTENMHLAFFDIRTMFNENGTLKPVSEWSDSIGASVKSIEVNELFEGSGQDRIRIGETKKIAFWDKGAAIDKLMKHLGAYEKDNKQKENNPMFIFMQQLMGTSLPVIKNPHLIEGTVIDDDE
jgi:phage terminase small subunit